MSTRLRWLLLLLLLAVLLPAAHAYWRGRVGVDTSLNFRMLWSGAFLVFGAVLLGALARWHPSGSINRWRSWTLFGGALLAAVEVWLVSKGGVRGFNLEIWMAAMLGLALALIATRWIPETWLRYWLAMERRERAPGQPAAG